MIKLIVLPILLVFFSCKNRGGHSATAIILSIDSLHTPTVSGRDYFPEQVLLDSADNFFDNNAKFINRWFSDALYSFREPMLYNFPDSIDVCRFLWLSSRHSSTLALRMVHFKNKVLLFVKVLEMNGPQFSTNLKKDSIIELSLQHWDDFFRKLAAINFREMSSYADDEKGKDGEEWVLEASMAGQYHFVERWSPDESQHQDFKECCEYLLLLAGCSITPNNYLKDLCP